MLRLDFDIVEFGFCDSLIYGVTEIGAIGLMWCNVRFLSFHGFGEPIVDLLADLQPLVERFLADPCGLGGGFDVGTAKDRVNDLFVDFGCQR